MGVAIWGQIPRKNIGLDGLAGRMIAFDAWGVFSTGVEGFPSQSGRSVMRQYACA